MGRSGSSAPPPALCLFDPLAPHFQMHIHSASRLQSGQHEKCMQAHRCFLDLQQSLRQILHQHRLRGNLKPAAWHKRERRPRGPHGSLSSPVHERAAHRPSNLTFDVLHACFVFSRICYNATRIYEKPNYGDPPAICKFRQSKFIKIELICATVLRRGKKTFFNRLWDWCDKTVKMIMPKKQVVMDWSTSKCVRNQLPHKEIANLFAR